MLKSINYIRSIFSLFIFLLLSSCGDNGGFFTSRISGVEFGDPQEVKLRKYYSRLEKRKTSLGLLRQDGGGSDTPFYIDDIVEAFEQLAFYNEYDIDKNKLLPNSNAVSLAKWKSNTNISVLFGGSVDKKQKDKEYDWNFLKDPDSPLFSLSLLDRILRWDNSEKRLIELREMSLMLEGKDVVTF